MKIGDTVHFPSPKDSNENWSVYRAGVIVAMGDDSLEILPRDSDAAITVPRDEALAVDQFFAYIMSAKNGGA